MKLYFLGTCAGSEPMPDRKHMSFALECDENIYWFDAGESCSHTAHNLGVDLLNVKKVVISHPHMDHVGGLGNLLWNIRKLYLMKKPDRVSDIDVYIPNLQTWEGIMMILRNTEGNFKIPFCIQAHKTHDGVLFDDGSVRVTAFHNLHISTPENQWQSYSFLIECREKRIVYSGDVKCYSELDTIIGTGCDNLIIETGHFGIDDVYAYTKNKAIGKIYFTHNGREIINSSELAAEKVNRLFKNNAAICFDGMVELLE